ncbi:MAG: molybdenum ABC transporter ATP-binding protein [Gammaproteobacteria bacterium]|nr:molybdenum ABC transporter ATP-binding protein [Gammaproteobacteria bacterium]NND55164.1 molybdenum ABC transporter ATP-binding protein [Gammaproteobacteria bacterium]
MTVAVDLQLRRGLFRLRARFEVPASGVTAISGPSGAGKTSLLRAIAGLERGRGLVKVGEQVWQDAQQFIPVHQRGLGYVFQEASLFAHLDVRGNLEYGLQRRAAQPKPEEFATTVELLGLSDLLTRSTANLSGGERQRVAIGRALLAGPRILLMDEPLAALDRRHKQELLPYLETLHDELQIPVLYVSHSPDEVARLADHLLLIDHGNVVASGPTAEVLTRLDLPAAHEEDAAAVITGTITRYDDDYSLCEVTFGEHTLFVPSPPRATGTTLRLRILPRDVSLTLHPQQDTSILNILPVNVTAVAAKPDSRCLIGLEVGGQQLLAQITRKSADALQLAPGKRVYAQIKTVALLS